MTLKQCRKSTIDYVIRQHPDKLIWTVLQNG